MIIPSIGRLILPDGTRRQLASEIGVQVLQSWKEEAEHKAVASVNWQDTNCSDLATQHLDRIRNYVGEAERDTDPNRVERLGAILTECLQEANQRVSNLNDSVSGTLSRFGATLTAMFNPFLACRTTAQAESVLVREQANAQRRLDESRSRTQTTRVQYEQQRQRMQVIESGRNTLPDVQPDESTVSAWVVPITVSLLVLIIAAVLLNRFFGSSWTGWLAGLVLGVSTFGLFLRQRANAIEDSAQSNFFPEEFKTALQEYAAAQVAQYVAERVARVWEERKQAWSGFLAQHAWNNLEGRLNEITVWLEREQANEPSGFFAETLPGEIQLRGRALTQLIVEHWHSRVGRERFLNMVASSLNARPITPQSDGARSTSDTVEDLLNTVESALDDLSFSEAMSIVLDNPQGVMQANTWLKRFKDQVLSPASLRAGTSHDSDVRETLRCGLPGGLANPLAREMARRFNCDVQDSTIPNGLELLCFSRNIRLDDLSSTVNLKTSYEKLPIEVRQILFNFPSRAQST